MAVKRKITCPHCGKQFEQYANPLPTVDIIIEIWQKGEFRGIVLIERKNFPKGWALPGGFVDYGETVEEAAVREAYEETDLKVTLTQLMGVYSEPDRDPRHHTLSVVFLARAEGVPKAGDDAGNVRIFSIDQIPSDLAFDHAKILADYREKKWDQR